jgi:hypothetical protein
LKSGLIFAVANSTRKIRETIWQRRNVIVQGSRPVASSSRKSTGNKLSTARHATKSFPYPANHLARAGSNTNGS